MTGERLFKRAAVIGVGLIGGSVARVLKNRGLADRVIGAGRSRANLDTALALGIIDEALPAEDAVKDADLVVLCGPVLSVIPTLEAVAPHIKNGSVVTDAGSTKKEIVERAEKIAGGRFDFVGSHPIAGTEKSGAGSSFESLFEGHRCIVTPSVNTNPTALETVKKVWEAAGMEIVEMDAQTHDMVLGAVSHLPHMVVYSLVNTVFNEENPEDVVEFAAGGFKDTTRIGSSPGEMWADIAMSNRAALKKLMAKMRSELEKLESVIEKGDRKSMIDYFEKARRFREKLK